MLKDYVELHKIELYILKDTLTYIFIEDKHVFSFFGITNMQFILASYL